MKTVKIIPDGWECMIEDCPPGFFYYDEQLCFKTEYMDTDEDGNGQMQVYCSSGETFMPRKIKVQPVVCETEYDED